MGRIVKISYKDIIVLNPDLTPEERENRVKEADEECKKLTEWPVIY